MDLNEIVQDVEKVGGELLDAVASAFANTTTTTTTYTQNPQYQQYQQNQQFQNLQYQQLQQTINQAAQAWISNQNFPQVQEIIRRYVLNQSIQELNIMNKTLRYYFNNYPAFSQKVNLIFGWFYYWRNFYKK